MPKTLTKSRTELARPAPVRPLYAKLPCGRRAPNGLTRDEVLADQRRRLQGGMIEAVARHGYAAASVSEVVALAGVSKKTLYKHFASKQECFLVTYDSLVREQARRTAAAYRKQPRGEWTAALRGVLEALVEDVCAQPQAAWLMLVEMLLAGSWAQERTTRGEVELAQGIERGLDRAPEKIVLSEVLLRGIVHGVWHVARERLLEERTASLSGAGRDLLEWMLTYCSASAAQLSDARAPVPRAGAAMRGSSTRDSVQARPTSVADERARLLYAAAQITADGGYAELTGAYISEQAGVRPQRFDQLFRDGVQECLFSYLQLCCAEALACALREAEHAPDWPTAVYRAVNSLLGYIADDRVFARVAFIEIFAAGRAVLAARAELLRGFSQLLLRRVPKSLRPSPLTAETITGAVWGVIRHEVLHDRAHQLHAHSPEIAYLVLAPLTGGETAARRVLALTSKANIDDHSRRRPDGKDRYEQDHPAQPHGPLLRSASYTTPRTQRIQFSARVQTPRHLARAGDLE
jgi:AcrR family transcriptional regulator